MAPTPGKAYEDNWTLYDLVHMGYEEESHVQAPLKWLRSSGIFLDIAKLCASPMRHRITSASRELIRLLSVWWFVYQVGT